MSAPIYPEAFSAALPPFFNQLLFPSIPMPYPILDPNALLQELNQAVYSAMSMQLATSCSTTPEAHSPAQMPTPAAEVPKLSSAPLSEASSPSETPNPRCSSSPEEDSQYRVKRGRPQQEIEDEDDPSSQKRRHRRMYARQYRAHMRQRVDEVKSLREEVEELRKQLHSNDAELSRTKGELSKANLIIGGLLHRPAPY